MYSFNLYDWYANFRDFSKAWQMKLKLWHLILQKIVKVSSGQKNQTFCQIYMKKSFLSLPITFSVLVNVIPYQIFIQNTQITVFKKISTKFGALPLLQECPWWLVLGKPTFAKKDEFLEKFHTAFDSPPLLLENHFADF